MADLDLKSRQSEIQKERLEKENFIVAQKLANEKSTLDLELKRIQIEKENAELLSQKIALLERIANIQLSNEDKKIIVSLVLPKALIITQTRNPNDSEDTG